MRAASNTNGNYLSEWRKFNLENDTLYFETFGEWRDSTKVTIKYIGKNTIEMHYHKNINDDDFKGSQRLELIKEDLNFNSITEFWLNYEKRQERANCKNKS